ncbi:restriction endonuclease subunit S [Hoyosella altamirensis]|uniref:restriction endonuclease subunit S n=1 Tax=Hoyosella altamirensis TaxID=616997 RepID=UPI0009445750|nr:restriction endonuclease subunit S [Hoyosella altamirensis]
MVALGEVVDCLDRQRVPVTESERIPGDVPYYGANGQQGWIDRAIFNEPLVIVAEDGGHFSNPSRGVAYRIAGPSWVNNHGHVLRSRSQIDHDFLYHTLRNYDFAPYISGSTRSKLTQGQLLRAEVPLPPLDEQRRIAAILDHADALRAKRRQVLAHLDDLTQAIFHDMFGDPATWASRWPMGVIGDMTQSVRYGTSAKAGDSGEWPILRMGNVTDSGRLDLRDLKYIDLSVADVPRYTVRRGDMLFNRTNSKEKVGKTAVVRTDRSLALAGYLVRVRCKPEHQSEFVSAYLTSPFGQAIRRRLAKAAVNQANINASELQRIPIALPSSDLQRKFTARIESVDAQRTAVQNLLISDDQLFTSLQSRAFRGEL